MTCSTPGCLRATRTTASGLVMAMCDAHTRLVLRDAFASDSAPAIRADSPLGPVRSSGHADPATHTAALPLAVTQASPAH